MKSLTLTLSAVKLWLNYAPHRLSASAGTTMPEFQWALLIQSFPWGDCTIPKELLAEFGDDEEAQESQEEGKHRKQNRRAWR